MLEGEMQHKDSAGNAVSVYTHVLHTWHGALEAPVASPCSTVVSVLPIHHVLQH
jgi:hypothetical protein